MSHYIPTTSTAQVRARFAEDPYGNPAGINRASMFDRWLAEHEQNLREMIAQEILDHINTEPTYMHVIEWRDAMETAAQIALGDTK